MNTDNLAVNGKFKATVAQNLEGWLGITVVTILILLPLNGLWARLAAAQQFGDSGMLLEWVQIAILIFLVLGSIWLGFWRRHFFSWGAADYCLLTYLVIAGLSYFWSNQSLLEHLTGLRYSALLFLFYFVARVIKQRDNWFRGARLAMVVVATIASIQLILWWLFPITREWLPFSVGDLAGQLPRLRGSFSGPNQLATFLVLAWLGAIVFDHPKRYWVATSSIVIILILATFSRSALLGLTGGLLAVAFLLPEYRRRVVSQIGVIALVTILMISLVSVSTGNLLSGSLFRTISDSGHLESSKTAIRAIFDAEPATILLGHGAGTSGPSTLNWYKSVISENWYLQTAYEYGLVGLLAVLGFFGTLLWRAYRQGQAGLLAMTVALMMNALFLHPLSDNAAATLLFFIGAGVLYLSDQHQVSNGDKIESIR